MNGTPQHLTRRADRIARALILTAALQASTLDASAQLAPASTRYGMGTAPADMRGTPQRDSAGIQFGAPVKLGNGTVRTYVVTAAGAPIELGVAISESAMNGLPDHHTPGGIEIEPGHFTWENVLPLPAVNPTPVQHVVVNWNPGGHEPPGIYDRAHFDFHFYYITPTERMAIDPKDPAYKAKAERLPAPELIPAGYVLPAPAAVPMMGVHWIDPKSPEFNGQGFSRTFIYGSWDGRVIFAEPMITKAFLDAKPDVTFPLPHAPKYAERGYYPGGYTVRWDADAKEYRVALTKFEQKH